MKRRKNVTNKHTPGPWQVRHADGLFAIASEDGWIGTTDGDRDENAERANAHLIAAAPEMYQALLTIAVWPEGEPIERIQGIASAALDKARGER